MVDLECVLRTAVGAFVLRSVVDRAAKLARDVARALWIAVVGVWCGHLRRRGLHSVRSEFPELFPREERDQLRGGHVWIFVRECTFELLDHLQRFIRKLERQLRFARCCGARALGPRKIWRLGGNEALGFAFSLAFDTRHKRKLLVTARLRVTKESARLGDVGECESSIADRGSDLGKIFEKSHGLDAPLSLVFGVAQFFDGVVKKRSALEVAVELSTLDFFEMSKDVREESALFANKRE